MVKTIIKLSHNNFILATVEIVYPTSESKFAAYEAGFSEPTLNFRTDVQILEAMNMVVVFLLPLQFLPPVSRSSNPGLHLQV